MTDYEIKTLTDDITLQSEPEPLSPRKSEQTSTTDWRSPSSSRSQGIEGPTEQIELAEDVYPRSIFEQEHIHMMDQGLHPIVGELYMPITPVAADLQHVLSSASSGLDQTSPGRCSVASAGSDGSSRTSTGQRTPQRPPFRLGVQ